MTIFEILAIYEDGVLRPLSPLAIPEHTQVRVSVDVPAPIKQWADMTEAEREGFYHQLEAQSGQIDHALIREHREAGVSMYGTSPDYPGQIVERTPEGQLFIVRRDGELLVRLRQVEG